MGYGLSLNAHSQPVAFPETSWVANLWVANRKPNTMQTFWISGNLSRRRYTWLQVQSESLPALSLLRSQVEYQCQSQRVQPLQGQVEAFSVGCPRVLGCFRSPSQFLLMRCAFSCLSSSMRSLIVDIFSIYQRPDFRPLKFLGQLIMNHKFFSLVWISCSLEPLIVISSGFMPKSYWCMCMLLISELFLVFPLCLCVMVLK